MSEVQDFLEDIGKEMGRTPEQMKPFVDKLQSEWYDSMASLRGISEDKWDTFGLPGRLVDAIKVKLGMVASSPSAVPSTATAADPLAAAPQVAASQSVLKLPVEIMPQSPEETMGANLDDLGSIVATSLPKEALEIALTTLLKLTDAVLANPEHEKTRKIRIGNAIFQERCGRYPSCMEFLGALGFKHRGEFLIMEKAFISRLTDGRKALEHIAKEANLAVPPLPATFNPYVSSISSMATNPVVPKGQLAESRLQEAQNIKLELEEKKKIMALQGRGSGMISAPRVFWKASLGRLEDAISALQSSTDSGDSSVLMDVLQCMQSADSSKFHSREKAELVQLKKKKVYNVTVLRVNLPNKIVLELNLFPRTPWSVVYEAVEACLAEEVKSVGWYLYDTPPIRKFERLPKETLLSSGLVPGAMVQFGLDNREQDYHKLGKCVNEQLFATLPPEPQPPAPAASFHPQKRPPSSPGQKPASSGQKLAGPGNTLGSSSSK
eukprot:GEMP01030781.1.p1 GENE.GEMP01030781.1~~GEMP01030781.1.p1  ORF type:complete len:494 (+),score=125.83 GEMP01030781.1:74-1555(+)